MAAIAVKVLLLTLRIIVAQDCLHRTKNRVVNMETEKKVYVISTSKSTWNQSQECCKRHGGRLATLLNKNTLGELAKALSLSGGSSVFLGVKLLRQNQWITINGEITLCGSENLKKSADDEVCCYGKLQNYWVEIDADSCDDVNSVVCKSDEQTENYSRLRAKDLLNKTWFEAREYCLAKGSDLLDTIPTNPQNWMEGVPFWLGISNLQWIWHKDERSIIHKDDECLIMKKQKKTYGWSTMKCSNQAYFLCEMPKDPKRPNLKDSSAIFAVGSVLGLVLVGVLLFLLHRFCKNKSDSNIMRSSHSKSISCRRTFPIYGEANDKETYIKVKSELRSQRQNALPKLMAQRSPRVIVKYQRNQETRHNLSVPQWIATVDKGAQIGMQSRVGSKENVYMEIIG